MKTTITDEKILRAIDRVYLLMKEPVLQYAAENIMVNAPVAIHQIAFQNEMNGILLGLCRADLRVIKLPISKDQKSAIKKAFPYKP